MRYARFVLLLVAAAACSACFQFSTVINVKPDGSGTIDQHLLFTPAAVAQLRQFAALSGRGKGGAFDPLSEQQARDAAASLGPGVTYVSSVPIDSPEGVGRDIKYAFTDINTLKLDQAPPPPGGGPTPGRDGLAGAEQRVTFALAKQASGNALLTIKIPQVPGLSNRTGTGGPTAEQLAMFKPMLAGARLSIAIEPAGRLVATSSPWVTGQRVILLELNVDDLLRDETLLKRLQAARTPEEAKAILKEVPGLKANLDPEITIEFQ